MATASQIALATPAETPVYISLSNGQPAAERQTFEMCKRTLPGWDALEFSAVEFTRITGGITNILLKAMPPESSGLEPVAVKVFGDNTEVLIDRDVERAVATQLALQGFGPRVLAIFTNGRAEEFLYCKTLKPTEMCDPAFVPRIGRLLAAFHRAEVVLPKAQPPLFDTIWRWLDMAKALDFSGCDEAKAAAFAAVDFGAMEADIREVQAACAATRAPLVFGHNDLLSGNILILQKKGFDPAAPDLGGPLQLIDFEYCAPTPRGFDIGNHFNEYAGFECDYTRYPGRAQQELFLKAYAGEDVSERQLDELCAEADVHALASHMFWGVWALLQARYSPVEFDYMSYSAMRWAECRRRKDEFLGRASAVFRGH